MTDSSSQPCPTCGSPLEAGVTGSCPSCLMRAAMQPTEPQPPDRQTPALEAVRSAFPQLEILELIGQGGMGCVFKARQPKLDRVVALKLLPASLAERDAAFAGRFEREGQLLARLHHPNIVAVHDSGTAGEFFYLIMEFVEGVNLRQAMRARRFTPAQALAIVPHICDALQYAHDEGVLHRDIKPENILLDGKGRVKLVDFGIAKLVGDEVPELFATSSRGTHFTQSGAAIGTPQYMAPEQRDTPADVDHRADIYSLGVVFYELLTGELPRDRFAPPSAKSDADPRVDAIVQQALEKERERRQHSAGEVKTQVERVTRQATPASAPARRASVRGPILIHALLVFAILLILGFVVPRFLIVFKDMISESAELPKAMRLLATMNRNLTLCTFVILAAFAADAALCILLGRLTRLGLRVWNGVVVMTGLMTITIMVIAIWAPLTTLMANLRSPVDSIPALTAIRTSERGDGIPNLEAPSPENGSPHHEIEAAFREYEQLLTALREATFELELVGVSEIPETDESELRARIKSRCDRLAKQTETLRQKILAVGKRAAEGRER